MRSPEAMQKLILDVAREDENIRAVLLTGSRANPDCPADIYQDFDIVYFVRDVTPYWDNLAWVTARFGAPALLQRPESMRLTPPDGDGSYVYLMLFPDGNRIDLRLTVKPHVPTGEPAALLLDKDGTFPALSVRPDYWYVRAPDAAQFADCCNEFHWCLNNVAKGIARDELPYAMEQFNHYVRDMLTLMLGWCAGARHGFAVSVGKSGKYLKKYLPADWYQRLLDTYSGAEPARLWAAVFAALDLFGDAARDVARRLSFSYGADEERAIRRYLEQVRGGAL